MDFLFVICLLNGEKESKIRIDSREAASYNYSVVFVCKHTNTQPEMSETADDYRFMAGKNLRQT